MKMSRALKFLPALMVTQACCLGGTPSFWVIGWGNDGGEPVKGAAADGSAPSPLIVGGKPLIGVAAFAAGDHPSVLLKSTEGVVGCGVGAYVPINGLS